MTINRSEKIIKPIQHAEFLLESPDELVRKVINEVVDLVPVVLYTSRPENEDKDLMYSRIQH